MAKNETKKLEAETPEVDAATVATNEAAKDAKAKVKVNQLHHEMKKKLDKCKKVRCKIPVDKTNEKDLMVSAQINGYTYIVKRGESVELPEPVYKLLERAGYV